MQVQLLQAAQVAQRRRTKPRRRWALRFGCVVLGLGWVVRGGRVGCCGRRGLCLLDLSTGRLPDPAAAKSLFLQRSSPGRPAGRSSAVEVCCPSRYRCVRVSDALANPAAMPVSSLSYIHSLLSMLSMSPSVPGISPLNWFLCSLRRISGCPSRSCQESSPPQRVVLQVQARHAGRDAGDRNRARTGRCLFNHSVVMLVMPAQVGRGRAHIRLARDEPPQAARQLRRI